MIEIIVKQPATSRFVAQEIYKFFVADEIDDDAVDQIADAYLSSKYEIRDVLRFVFNSDFFKSARFNRVKSPIEFIVGTVQLAGQHRSPHQFGLAKLAELSSMMGQELLNPPTVEGWHTGREWIDSAFLVERLNFATEKLSDNKSPGIMEISNRNAAVPSTITRENLLDLCASKFVSVDLDDSTRTVLLQELSSNDDVKCEGAEFTNAVAEVLTMISTSKEYQML